MGNYRNSPTFRSGTQSYPQTKWEAKWRRRRAAHALSTAPTGKLLGFIESRGGEVLLNQYARGDLRRVGINADQLDAALTILSRRGRVVLDMMRDTIRVRLARRMQNCITVSSEVAQ